MGKIPKSNEGKPGKEILNFKGKFSWCSHNKKAFTLRPFSTRGEGIKG